jgi:hypothetical protein
MALPVPMNRDIVPRRRQMPDVFDHGSSFEIGQRGRTCTCDRSVPNRVCWLLHYALMADPNPDSESGLNPPADNPDASGLIDLRVQNGLPSRTSASEGWWEVLVTLQFVASDTYFVTPDLQSGSRITSYGNGSGGWESCPTETEVMRLA